MVRRACVHACECLIVKMWAGIEEYLRPSELIELDWIVSVSISHKPFIQTSPALVIYAVKSPIFVYVQYCLWGVDVTTRPGHRPNFGLQEAQLTLCVANRTAPSHTSTITRYVYLTGRRGRHGRRGV